MMWMLVNACDCQRQRFGMAGAEKRKRTLMVRTNLQNNKPKVTLLTGNFNSQSVMMRL
jgi:hypothetical protein